jgi:hypothetical protein
MTIVAATRYVLRILIATGACACACGQQAALPNSSTSSSDGAVDGWSRGVDSSPSRDASSAAGSDPGSLSPGQAIEAAKRGIDAECSAQDTTAHCQGLRRACVGGTPRLPYRAVTREFTCHGAGCSDFEAKFSYYLVPFDREGGTTCVVMVMIQWETTNLGHMTPDQMKPGDFLGVKYWDTPRIYLPLSESAAASALSSRAAPPPQAPTLVYYPVIDTSFSPYLPFWMFVVEGKEWFVSQTGKVLSAVMLPSAP